MASKKSQMSLLSSPIGKWIRILSLQPGTLRAQFIRLGIVEGERILCLERLPGGTVILQKNRQQIAIGHQLAAQILIAVIQEEEAICA